MNKQAADLLGQIVVIAFVVGIGVGLYYLVRWLAPQHLDAAVIAIGVAIGTQLGDLGAKVKGLFSR